MFVSLYPSCMMGIDLFPGTWLVIFSILIQKDRSMKSPASCIDNFPGLLTYIWLVTIITSRWRMGKPYVLFVIQLWCKISMLMGWLYNIERERGREGGISRISGGSGALQCILNFYKSNYSGMTKLVLQIIKLDPR